MVYFMRNSQNGAVKIGWSKTPSIRQASLQTGSADTLRIEYVIENVEPAFERHVHEISERYHISGEWFQGTVIENHLLKHPWFAEHMQDYGAWLKRSVDELIQSGDDSAVLEHGDN